MDFSKNEIRRLVELWEATIPDQLTSEKLARILSIKSQNPNFRKIKKWLIDNDIIKEISVEKPCHFLSLNKKTLKEMIPEIEFIKYIHDRIFVKMWGEKILRFE
jgi:hypothetical protein